LSIGSTFLLSTSPSLPRNDPEDPYEGYSLEFSKVSGTGIVGDGKGFIYIQKNPSRDSTTTFAVHYNPILQPTRSGLETGLFEAMGRKPS
jgi:hypothetical protein